MTAVSSVAEMRRRFLLCIVAAPCLLWSAEGHTQDAKPSQVLDPVVVQPTAQPPRARRAGTGHPSRAARARPQRNAAATTAAPVTVSTGPIFAAPTLNLTGAAPTGSRLGLTRLQTPASVDVISAQTISERGQQNIVDAVTQNAVGITASPSPGNGGLAFNARGFVGSGSVMTIYDGTQLYVGQGTATFPYDTWSAESIEVLRGPASVLYGAGAVGGAINVISKLPTWVPFNQAEISLDTNMTKRIAIDSGGPVSKDVAYRITATGNLSDGWVDRGNNSNVALHAALQIKQNEDITWTLVSDYADVQPQKYWGTPLVNRGILESIRFNNYNASDGIIHYKDNFNQVRTDWQIADGISVRNVVYYMDVHRHWRNIETYAFNAGSGLVTRTGNTEIYQAQQQVGDRMDATFRGHLFGMENTLVAGFDVNHIKFGRDANFLGASTGTSTVSLNNPVPGNYFSLQPTVYDYRSVTNQYSLFAENKLSVTEQLSLIGGIRQDEPTVSRTDFFNPAGSFEKSFSNTTWRVGAIYTPIRDLAFYAQYSTAVDPVNGILALSAANQNFTLATGKQVEVGVKQSFWGGRGEWTLAGYEIVKSNLLARDANNPNITVQVGQQSSRGVEASVGVLLDYGWRIDANTTFLQAKYDDFVQSVGGLPVNYAGNVPNGVSQNVSNVWATWGFAPNWSANAGIQIVGKAYADAANTLARPAYTVVNAGVQWKPDANTTVSLRVYNLFDEIYATGGGTNQWILGMPRTAQLAVNVRF